MTVLEFTNSVDGITNDFVQGASNEREFKSDIMDLLIKVAKPKLDAEIITKEKNALEKAIKQTFEPGVKDADEFITSVQIAKELTESGKVIATNIQVSKVMGRLNFKRMSHRVLYHTTHMLGYWVKRK